jgi:putative membrane protein
MLARWGIRFGTSLAAIAIGLLVSGALLSDFSLNATAVVEASLLFWIIHLVVQIFALRVLVREPSIALAGLLALASTVVSLIIVNAIASGLSIHGFQTYVLATLIMWAAISVGDIVGRRMIQARRAERRAER